GIESPDSVPTRRDPGQRSWQLCEILDVIVELVNLITVKSPKPIGAHRDLRKTSGQLVETTSPKVKPIDLAVAVNPPHIAATHGQAAECSGCLLELLSTKVIAEDLGGRVESPYFVGVAIIGVAWTYSDEIENT